MTSRMAAGEKNPVRFNQVRVHPGRGDSRKVSAAMSRTGIFIIMGIAALYFLVPIWWFIVTSTKSNVDLFSTSGFWFASPHFFDNLADVFARQGGVYLLWMRNSIFYAVVGGVLGTLISALAGYALAKYDFRGREAVFNAILSAVLVPTLLLTIPLYLVFSKIGLINTIWAMLIPSLISPFGIYLARIYASTIPDELIEAARVDGAGEFRIFATIAMRIMVPALATIFLIQFVGIWSNYFLPLMMLNDPNLQPLAVGIIGWQGQLSSGAHVPTNIVIFAAFLSVIPLAALFLTMQRYLKSGLALGSVK